MLNQYIDTIQLPNDRGLDKELVAARYMHIYNINIRFYVAVRKGEIIFCCNLANNGECHGIKNYIISFVCDV